MTTTYTFTNRRFIKRSGFIAKEGRTIPLNRISGVDFEIGVIDRIFGCGTLVVSDASTDGSVLLHDIPDVEQVQLQVANELHRLSGGDRRDDGA
nr:PH domain-containing protein [Nocardioides sp. zg-1308]